MGYALSTIWYERQRFLPAIMAVAFSAVLIAVQGGLVIGLLSMMSRPVDMASADLWIGYPGVQSVDLGRAIPERWNARVAAEPYRGNPVDVVPNLIVEVASPTDDAENLIAKAHEYLRGGAEHVCVVYPCVQQLYAYTAIDTAPRLFTVRDTLDAGDILPGFAIPLSPLFPILEPDPETHELLSKFSRLRGDDVEVLNVFGTIANHPTLMRKWLVFATYALTDSGVKLLSRLRQLLEEL